MPAPPAGLVTALRNGTATRHIFFKLDHSAGLVLAWDGIGEFALGADVYQGVRGMMQVQGVTHSADVQNHALEVVLNGVSLAAMQVTDPDIRGRSALLFAVWLDENGNQIASRTIFSGYGDILRTKIERDTLQLTVRIRAKMADWGSVPRAYYTPGSHNRLYPADTGFSQVKNLENATINGWSKDIESAGETLVRVTPQVYFQTNINGIKAGTTNFGMGVSNGAITPFPVQLVSVAGAATTLLEETSGAAVNAAAGFAQVGGVNVYLDIVGDIRSAGGKKLLKSGGSVSTDQVRQGKVPISDGTATTETLNTETYGSFSGFRRSALAAGAADNKRWVYAEKDTFVSSASLAGYSEVGTGAAVTIASGKMQVSGADCHVSTTGVILSPSGRRISLTADTSKYFRIWV
jgi:hypothetical protein